MRVMASQSSSSTPLPTFLLSVPDFTDIPDDTLRGVYTVYGIQCAVTAHDGSLSTFGAQRRFSEWRQLHSQQWRGSRAFPAARRLLHGQQTKVKRAEALQAWLCDVFDAYAAANQMPPPQLLHFVGVRAEALAGVASPPRSPRLIPETPEAMRAVDGGELPLPPPPQSTTAAARASPVVQEPGPEPPSSSSAAAIPPPVEASHMADAFFVEYFAKCAALPAEAMQLLRRRLLPNVTSVPPLLAVAAIVLWLLTNADLLCLALVLEHLLRRQPPSTTNSSNPPLLALTVAMYAVERVLWPSSPSSASPSSTPLGASAHMLWWGCALAWSTQHDRPILTPVCLVLGARVVSLFLDSLAAFAAQHHHPSSQRRSWVRLATTAQQLASIAACASLPLRILFSSESPDLMSEGALTQQFEQLTAWLVLSVLVKQSAEASELARWARLSVSLRREAQELEQKEQQQQLSGGSSTDPAAAKEAAAAAKAKRKEAKKAAKEAAAAAEADGWVDVGAVLVDDVADERGFKEGKPSSRRPNGWRRKKAAAAAPPGAWRPDANGTPARRPPGAFPPDTPDAALSLPAPYRTPTRAAGPSAESPPTADGSSSGGEDEDELKDGSFKAGQAPAPPVLASELMTATEKLLSCLPHELRELGMPIAQELFHGASGRAGQQARGLIQAIGAAASLVLSRALLDPDGRMRLWLGLKALADSAPMEGRMPPMVKAFTKQRHAFQLGLQGSMVLPEAFKVETHVPMSRLFSKASEDDDGPPERLTEPPEVGDIVRVRYPYHKPDKADAEEAMFMATITAVHNSSVEPSPAAAAAGEDEVVSSPRSPRSGLSAMLQRTASQPVFTVDIRYVDEVALSFGDQRDAAGLNVLDQIPEVGAMWRLWVKNLSIDVTVPSDERVAPTSTSTTRPASPSRDGGVSSGDALPEPGGSQSAPATRPSSPQPGEVSGGEASAAVEAANGDADAASIDGGGTKTISVDWAEPTSEQRGKGVFGSLVFTVALPLVVIRARLKSGRFWSDSTLLKLGKFTDAVIHFDHGKVHAVIRVSFERDGAYMAIEQLSLAVAAIRIESMKDHSRRWGVLLGTVSGLQWLLSGFLERKLLDLVSAAVVETNQRQMLVAWSEIPVFTELGAKMETWQQVAARRELLEGRAVRSIQRVWRSQRSDGRARRRPARPTTPVGEGARRASE